MATRGPTAVRTVLFDLDGTLADTLPSLADALNTALGETGREPIAPEALRPVITLGTRAIVARALGEAAQEESLARALAERFLAHYAVAAESDTSVFEGIGPLLGELAERRVRWGVVTNKLTRFARPVLRRIDPRGECVCLVGGDRALHPKPHPAPLLLACREAGCAPYECVYVGDAPGDVLAGRRAGMRTVAAAYGYLAEGEDAHRWGADEVVETPAALSAALARLALAGA